MLASGSHAGFLACYRSPLTAPPTGPCERSFENPFFRFAVTRIDPAISFREHDWDLGFLNTNRFNFFYPRASATGPLRWRIPIAATWQGVIERAEPWVARVTYVGEVGIAVGSDGPAAEPEVMRLSPHYGPPVTSLVPMPAGRHPLRIQYLFDDGSRQGGPPPVGPWATLRIERGREPGGREPGAAVSTIRAASTWRGVATAADVAIVGFALPVALFYVGLLWRDAWLLALVGLATPLVDRLDPGRLGIPSSLGLCSVLALVAVSVLGRRWRRRLAGAYFATLYITLFTTLHTFRRLGVATLREGGSDPLTYESQARSILDTWSLEGGEPVFFMQPAFRYVRFLERLVLGDGDGFLSIAALAALYWALCFAFARLWPRPRPSRLRAIAFGASAGLTLALATSPPVVFFVQVSLSEYPTWIFLPLLFPLLFLSRSPREWLRGAALAGLSCLTRLNQIPPLLAVMAVFAWRAWRIRLAPVLVAVGLVLATLPLPVAHNLYYGGQLVWSTGNQSAPVNTVLPPRALLRFFDDSKVRARVWYQVDHMLYLHTLRDRFPRGEYVSWVAIHGIQLLWLVVGLLTLARRSAPAITKILLGLPLVYLGVHLVFVLDFYYPRHIVAGHLAMALVTLYALGRGFGPPRDRPAVERAPAR